MIEIKQLKKILMQQVMLIKKDTLQPRLESDSTFEEINRRFVVTEFVKTCDELVTGVIQRMGISYPKNLILLIVLCAKFLPFLLLGI